jgi:hypothetical protein
MTRLFSQTKQFEKVGLKKAIGQGAFDALLGDVLLNWCRQKNRLRKYFKNRFWRLQFIHLCFDVVCMDSLKENARKRGLIFSDSENSFRMDNAGRFCLMKIN